MAETSFTGIKSADYDKVLELANDYFSKHNLHLVEERIGDRSGKFVTSPKRYANLKDYEDSEIKPYLEKNIEFTTNFDFFADLPENQNWCVFSFSTRLAEYTLNIDEELTSFISRNLNTISFDFFEYTVVDQVLIRSFENGNTKDIFFMPGGGDGEIDIKQGYFKKYDSLIKDKESEILNGFWEHIGYREVMLDYYNEKSRRPMYLKGRPEDITKFLQSKYDMFYFM